MELIIIAVLLILNTLTLLILAFMGRAYEIMSQDYSALLTSYNKRK